MDTSCPSEYSAEKLLTGVRHPSTTWSVKFKPMSDGEAGERADSDSPSDPHLVHFPKGFFARQDESADTVFYRPPRLLTHIDDGAIEAVGLLYRELAINGVVLDLMSSWISHFAAPPGHLSVLGMNQAELAANPMASAAVVHDLNRSPILPFEGGSFDDVVCCVSVDYLARPLDVFSEVGRVLKPGGRFVCTFSNRLFPSKAIRGWLANDDRGRMAIVERYFELTGSFGAATGEVRKAVGEGGDPLYAVHAQRRV